jgi:hypothetical protein
MDYPATSSLSASPYPGTDMAPRPADLPSLRGSLADCVERAREVAMRVEAIGELVFGPVPTSNGNGVKGAPGPGTLSDLVSDLDTILYRIGSGLNRL